MSEKTVELAERLGSHYDLGHFSSELSGLDLIIQRSAGFRMTQARWNSLPRRFFRRHSNQSEPSLAPSFIRLYSPRPIFRPG